MSSGVGPTAHGLSWPHCGWRRGSAGFAGSGAAGGAESVAVGAGFEDDGVEGEPVNYRGDQPRVRDHGSPLTWKGRFEAVMIEAFSSRSVTIWNSSSAPRASSCT